MNISQQIEMRTQKSTLFPGHPTISGGKLPRDSRWLADKLKNAHGGQVLQIVTALDNQMNNTSLILHFKAGSKTLLFPGDAQIENWKYALSQDNVKELFGAVDVYKVGHHGSLNATPKSLWKEFDKRKKGKNADKMKTILSTKLGKHGHVATSTEVPRKTLLDALTKETELHSTHTLDPDKLYTEVTIDLR
jgi:hypothetical protein